MADIFTLQGSVNVDTGKVATSLKDMSKNVDEAGKGLDNVDSKSSKLGKVLGGLGTTIVSTFAFSKIEGFVKESVTGAEKAATSNAKLETVLKAASHATDEQVTSLKSYASELSKTGVISAGLNKTAMSQLSTFGLQSDSIKKLIPQLDNLAVNQKGVNATSEDMMGYANMVGKAMQGSATAMTRVGVTMTDAQKKIIETGTEEQKASTIAEVLASNYGNLNEEIAKTPEGKAKVLSNNLASLKTQLGTVFLPVVSEVVGKLKDMATWFTSLSPTTQKVIMVVGLVVALLPSLIGMISGIVTILGVFTPVATTATIATGGMATATTGLMLPILAIIAVIGVLIATGVLLYKHWDEVEVKASQVWEGIKGIFSIFSDWLAGVFTTDWSNSFGVFGECLNAFLANISNIWNAIKEVFSGVIDFVAGAFSGDWGRAWEGVKEIFGGIMDGLGAVIKAPLNGIIALVNMAIDGLNSISVDIPDFIPGIGGQHFGVDISKMDYLYTGAVFDEPTLLGGNTVVGDKYKGQGKQKEWVLPDEKLRNTVAQVVREEISKIVITMDGREVARAQAKYQDEFDNYNIGRNPSLGY